MSKQKNRITRKITKLGAAWATTSRKHCSPNDPLEDQAEGRKTYHIHPDATHPHQSHIQRFGSLRELEEWLDGKLRLPAALEAAVIAAQKAGGQHPAPAALLSALDWDGQVLGHTKTLHRAKFTDPWKDFEDPTRAFRAAEQAFHKALGGR